MRRRWQDVDGILLLDKALGISSNAALQTARRAFQAAKAGHTGTLDPLASGLLPVMFGEATKFSQMLLDADKSYCATVKLGITTTTGDAEGQVLFQHPANFTPAQITRACEQFLGSISQTPPMYSALKHEGKALYEYARKGVEIEREEREVFIHELTLSDITPDTFVMQVRCSKGTYIRTLAEDIGNELGCGAHLTALRRTSVGPLTLAKAISQEALDALAPEERFAHLLPLDTLLLDFPEIKLDVVMSLRFSQGQTLSNVGYTPEQTGLQVRVYSEQNQQFLGLAQINEFGGLKPKRLLSSEGSVI